MVWRTISGHPMGGKGLRKGRNIRTSQARTQAFAPLVCLGSLAGRNPGFPPLLPIMHVTRGTSLTAKHMQSQDLAHCNPVDVFPGRVPVIIYTNPYILGLCPLAAFLNFFRFISHLTHRPFPPFKNSLRKPGPPASPVLVDYN
jgi:hypothetical protein